MLPTKVKKSIINDNKLFFNIDNLTCAFVNYDILCNLIDFFYIGRSIDFEKKNRYHHRYR